MVIGSFSERYGSRSSYRRYQCEQKGLRRLSRRGDGNWSESIGKLAKDAFLPQGYPDSVSGDYLAYQIWDSIQAFCSSITGTLATMAVLKGVGVGDSTATPLAATITWMLKDGTGMLGRILFAWMRGTDLDCYSKQWRLVADILNDVGMMLDLLAPLFPEFFLLIACLASLSRAVVGVAGSATRAAFVQHQARRNNMADVAAKDGSQETLVNLVGLVINLLITPMVAESQLLIWVLFMIFTALHLWANYRAVSVLCMETLNKNRLHIVMDNYLRTGAILSPLHANAREPIMTRVSTELTFDLGSSLSSALQSSTSYHDNIYEAENGGRGYVLVLGKTQRNVSICLRSDSTVSDQLEGVLAVEFANYIICANRMIGPVLSNFDQATHTSRVGVLKTAQRIVESMYPQLVTGLSARGWITSHCLLGAEDWRFTWSAEHSVELMEN